MDQPIFEKVLSVFKDLVSANGTDAVSLLKADHRKVEELFSEFEKSEDGDDKRALLKQIIKELTLHTTVEESKVYPILEGEDQEGSDEAYEEHHLVKVLLEELSGMDASDSLTQAKVKALSELVKHHVQEEELELLPELQSMDVDLEKLGAVITDEKNKLAAAGEAAPEGNVSTAELKQEGEANAVSMSSIKKTKAKSAAKKPPAKKGAKEEKDTDKKAAKSKATPKSTAKKAVAKKAAAKPAAKKAVAKKAATKPAVKKAVAKKSAAKPAAKKAVAKKSTAKPTAKPTAKKPLAKKAAAKPAAKKAVRKSTAKPVAKKPLAKKAAAKPAAKKPVAKKSTAKPVAKKAQAKPVAKKPAAKPTPINQKAAAKKAVTRKKAS